MQRQLDAFNLNYQFVDAIDKHELPSKEYRAAAAYQIGIDESKLENLFNSRVSRRLACQLSHFKVYNLMEKHKVPMACVLEDDGYLMPVFPKILAASQKAPWDILMLSHYSIRLHNIISHNLFKKSIFLYKLMRHEKYYPQLNPYFGLLLFFRLINSFFKKLFCQPIKYDYLSQIGAIPDRNKSSWHKVTSKHYIAKPHLENDLIGSAMGYMVTLPAAMKWQETILRDDEPLDRVPYTLYCDGEIDLRILVTPCVLIIQKYLTYSARIN